MDTNKTDIKFKIILRKKKGLINLYIRIQYLHLIAEVNSKVRVNTDLDIDPITRLPIDIDKSKKIQEIIELLLSYYYELKRNELLNHPSQIREAYKGKHVSGLLFISTFDEFIGTQESEVAGGNLKPGTMKNYYTTQKFLKDFVQDQFKRKEIPMTMFDRRFLDLFLAWMIKNKPGTNNGRSKHFERLKRFTTVSMNYGQITTSPFLGFKLKTTVNPRMYLTQEEVERIRNLDKLPANTEITRDLFLLMCNTGLAYSDLAYLDESKIENLLTGKVIKGNRQKTNTAFMAPLTEEAENIIERLSNHKIAKKKNSLLPVFCNQTFNRHLKEIGKKAEIDKELTSHVGRHSFATIALTAGVPLVTIQKVLGHSDLRMTLHYSRLVDAKLMDDMDAFKIQMNRKTPEPSDERITFKMRAV